MARYLALDVIRPGDIILSAGLTTTSIGIRLATFSRVSHAALALHPLIWFEALSNRGIAYKVVDPELVWDGDTIRLAMNIARGETYIVKRMKAAPYCADDPLARHAFARRLIEAASRFAFLNYATPDKFLPMLKFKLGSSGLARFIANNLNRSGTALFPGPFCSWLVADCYKDVGLNLFEVSSERVTPGAFDRSQKLHEIESRISAKPLDIVPRFKPFERQLRVAVALSSGMLSGPSAGSILVKSVAQTNVYIGALGKRGLELSRTMTQEEKSDSLSEINERTKQDFKFWQNRAQEALEKQLDALGEIDERSKRDFKSWQNRAQEALDNAYPSLASRSEPVDLLTLCQKECSRKLSGGSTCDDTFGCYRVTMGTLQTFETLYKVFPRPLEPSETDSRHGAVFSTSQA